MDGQIIMVLITLKMYHTTQMRTRKRNPQLHNLKIGFHKPPILNATFVFGLGHQETDEAMGFIIKVNLLNFCPLIPDFDLQISKFKH